MSKIPNYLKDKLLRPTGGFTKEDLEHLGVPWPPPPGWKKQVMSRLQLDAEYEHRKKLAREERKRAKRASKTQRRRVQKAEKPKAKKVKAKAPSKAFYQTWEWKKLRYETIKRYGAICMCCGSDYRIVVDHIKPRSRFPELELDPENLQVLCNDCNMGKSNDDETDWRPGNGLLTESEYDELKLVSQARNVLH